MPENNMSPSLFGIWGEKKKKKKSVTIQNTAEAVFKPKVQVLKIKKLLRGIKWYTFKGLKCFIKLLFYY